MSRESPELRLKRLAMRSMRRGIKEMDLILSDYAGRKLPAMTAPELDLYEALLEESDHDLLAWVSGAAETPAPYGEMIADIRAGAHGLTRPIG